MKPVGAAPNPLPSVGAALSHPNTSPGLTLRAALVSQAPNLRHRELLVKWEGLEKSKMLLGKVEQQLILQLLERQGLLQLLL